MLFNPILIISPFFIILAGMLIRYGSDMEKAQRRFFFFLLIMGTLALVFNAITTPSTYESVNWPLFQLASLMVPALIGILALTILNIRSITRLHGMARIGAVILIVAQVVLLYPLQTNPMGNIGPFVLPGVIILVIGWALGYRRPRLAVLLSVLVLAGVFWAYHDIANTPPQEPTIGVLGFALPVGFYLISALVIVLPAVLITNALSAPAESSTAKDTRSHWSRILMLSLGLLLPFGAAYVVYWGTIWDGTNDGIFGIIVAQFAMLTAIGAGMLMALALRGKYLLAGLAFMVGMPLLLALMFSLGLQTSYHEIAEDRAAYIAQALAQFQSREGRYPQTLAELTPSDLPYIESPIMLPGEDWCYQGGTDFYRLASFYREYFSSPISLHIYQSAGEAPPGDWDCNGREAAVREQYPWPGGPSAYQPVQPTALPLSDLDFPKTVVDPLLDGVTTAPGSWSPDSAYFFFGAQTVEDTLTLHFLVQDTGEICPVDRQYTLADTLYGQHAWLPDGRVFYTDSQGKMVIITPCTDTITDVTDRLGDTFTRIAAYAPETGLMFLQGEATYWILDTASLTMRQVEGVMPNPYDFHWDNFAWLPGGEEVVISHLNGRDRTEGSTLYQVSGRTGAVINSLALDLASDQSAPFVEALAKEQVILSGEGGLLLVDLATDPPTVTDVMADIFHLEVTYPFEMSSTGWYTESGGESYYLVLRLNHPRNTALYWYHSTDDRIEILDNNRLTLLLMPDNQMWDMSPWEDQPTYVDKYEVITLENAASTLIQFPGHVPRSYPRLSFKYLPPTDQIVVASSQGIALHSLATGELNAFFDTGGAGFSPQLIVAPDGESIIVSKDFGPLYWLRVDEGK